VVGSTVRLIEETTMRFAMHLTRVEKSASVTGRAACGVGDQLSVDVTVAAAA
jgi:hypothetical protein